MHSLRCVACVHLSRSERESKPAAEASIRKGTWENFFHRIEFFQNETQTSEECMKIQVPQIMVLTDPFYCHTKRHVIFYVLVAPVPRCRIRIILGASFVIVQLTRRAARHSQGCECQQMIWVSNVITILWLKKWTSIQLFVALWDGTRFEF